MTKYTNDELLDLIRKDRPTQVIHEIFSFKETEFGIIMAKVDMEADFMGTTIRHALISIPYPIQKYNKLTQEQQFYVRWLDQ